MSKKNQSVETVETVAAEPTLAHVGTEAGEHVVKSALQIALETVAAARDEFAAKALEINSKIAERQAAAAKVNEEIKALMVERAALLETGKALGVSLTREAGAPGQRECSVCNQVGHNSRTCALNVKVA